MPPLESVMKPLGTPMPAFDLPDRNGGGTISSRALAGSPVLVMFLCNHCPYVKHMRDELARLGKAELQQETTFGPLMLRGVKA